MYWLSAQLSHHRILLHHSLAVEMLSLSLQVKECLADSVRCISVNSATLSDRRGVNLPGAKVTLPAVSEKDKADIKFGIEQGVDVIFASFIRTADQVKEIKEFLKVLKGWCWCTSETAPPPPPL